MGAYSRKYGTVIEVSTEYRFILKFKNLGTSASVHLIKGVHLIWGPLNTGFTVTQYLNLISYKIPQSQLLH